MTNENSKETNSSEVVETKTTPKEKARYFTFLLYPESIPDDWALQLESLDLPIAISPLHDKDLNGYENADGTPQVKKAHYHVILIAKNPVTTDSIRNKIKRLLGKASINKVQIVKTSVRNTYLYLTHESKDAIAKNKVKYDKEDIVLLNNFDIDRYITLDVEEKDEMFDLICDLIDEYDLANIRELRRFVKAKGEEHGIANMKVVNSVIRSHTGLIRLNFDAVYQERKYGRSDYDKKTGEVKNFDVDE